MNHFGRLFIATMAIALLILGAAPAFADVEIYMQPPTFSGIFYASQNDAGGQGNFATVYDNFKIYSTTTSYYLDDVEWYGGYFNPSSHGNITAWTISIYADNAGQPGGLLWSQYDPVTHKGYMESCAFPNNTCGYDMNNIVGGYLLHPNTTYWLSVVPDMTFPPQWGWATGKDGDGLAYQDFFGNRSALGVDFAFNAQGVTPEPGTFILFGTGFLGLFGTLRRRFF